MERFPTRSERNLEKIIIKCDVLQQYIRRQRISVTWHLHKNRAVILQSAYEVLIT